jgi:hypothetical protein
MLIFNDQQLDSLLRADEARFVQATIDHVNRHCYADVRNLPPSSLREMVENGIARARSRGMQTSRDVIGFVAIMCEISPSFDEQQEISRALDTIELDAPNRLDQLMDIVSDEAWAEANASWSPKGWKLGLAKGDL